MSAVTSTVAPRRTALAWAAIAAGLVTVGAVMAVIAGISQLPAQGLLDPDAAGPDGARALSRILEDHGVEVVVARDRGAALAALAAGDATLALGDTSPLSDETVRDLVAQSRDVVVLAPRSRDLRLLLGDAASAGVASGMAAPACDLAEAMRAGPVLPGAVYTRGSAAEACYPSGDGWGLLVHTDDTGRIALFDAAALLTNDRLADDGNAALGVGLLGRHARVVWYLPGLADSDFATTPELGELTPPWVTPAMVLLVCAAAAAAVWRGRRFGPLVAERLPVTVRAGETTEGRARLYARAGDPTHAADRLRVQALRRMARTLGLGPAATASEISDAVAARLGADRGQVRSLLVDAGVPDDRALVTLADQLRAVEERLRHSLRPERNTP